MKVEFSAVEDVLEVNFNVLICSIGYEERAVHLLGKFKDRVDHVFGHVFEEDRCLSFDNNLSQFDDANGVDFPQMAHA